MVSVSDAFRDILYGGIAGAISKFIEHPFDTVKVRLQTQSIELFPTTWSCVRHTYNEEGIFDGFYRGLSSPLVGAFLENAVLFVSFNYAKHIGNTYTDYSDITKVFVAGAFAGACASFVLTPLELVKCRLQVQSLETCMLETKSASTLITIRSVVKEKGLFGLWQGQIGTFLRESLGGAIWFATYETTKKFLTIMNKDSEIDLWMLFFSGACAGLAFNASIFPIDTIKSTMQTKSIGVSAAVSTILTNNGARGLYRGVGITLVKCIPANGVIFYVYETLKSL